MKKVEIQSVRNSLPSYTKDLKITDKQIWEAIEYHYDMVSQYPDKSVLYFIHGWSSMKLIKQNLASQLFYGACEKFNAYGYEDIMNVIREKKLPKAICKFYIKTYNGGGDEIDLICSVYKIKAPVYA